MFFMVSGHSEDVDASGVFGEIKEQCEEGLQGRTPKAGLLFASIDAEHQELLELVNSAWPGLELIGCTTDGELSSNLGFREDSVTLMLFGSDTIDITAGLGRKMSGDVQAACAQAVEEARSKTTLPSTLCIALPESLTASGHQVVSSLSQALGEEVRLFGATSADQWRFTGTYQFHGQEVLSDTVPVLLFSGPLTCSFGVASGWKPVGEPGRVTQSEGNVVHEIDGAPAMEYYRKFLGLDAVPTGEFPLAILNEDHEIEYLRASVGVFDEGAGTITYLADIPQGSPVQITVADRDAILSGCRESLDMAYDNYPEGRTPEAAVLFSCSGRKLLLGTRTEEEYGFVREKLGADFPVAGFYGYGEIAPTLKSRSGANFHNETFVFLLLGS